MAGFCLAQRLHTVAAGDNKKERPRMLRLTLAAAVLAAIFMMSPFFSTGRVDSGAAIPVYHH